MVRQLLCLLRPRVVSEEIHRPVTIRDVVDSVAEPDWNHVLRTCVGNLLGCVVR